LRLIYTRWWLTMADLEHRTEDADHAPIPDRTTPQGTLALAVDHGHEEVDVNFRPLLQWIGILAGLILFSHLVSFGFYRVLEDTGKPDPNRPLTVFEQRVTPPEPRLLPNPVDSVRVPNVSTSAIQKYQTLKGPGDYGRDERKREERALEGLGFFDQGSGLPIIPDAAVATVAASAPPAVTTPTVEERMPSDPSGGTDLENRLR
jgi:hypothetical protein